MSRRVWVGGSSGEEIRSWLGLFVHVDEKFLKKLLVYSFDSTFLNKLLRNFCDIKWKFLKRHC